MIYDEKERKKEIEKRISLYRDAAAFTSRLKPIIKQFDGKMYNCKFDNAIRALSDNQFFISAYNSYGWFYIEYGRRGDYRAKITLISGYSCKSENLIKKQDRQDCILFDGKKIIAEKMIDSLNANREVILKKAFDLETAYNSIDGLLVKIETIKKTYRAITDNLPDIITDVYNIKKYAL